MVCGGSDPQLRLRVLLRGQSLMERMIESTRRISTYAQIRVTVSPKAAVHAAFWGIPRATPSLMFSKSSTKL